MKYAFLTTLIPKKLEEDVSRCSRCNMQDAANALQWNIYDGLCKNLNEEIKIFNILPIGSFPQYYSKAVVKKTIFDDINNQGHVNIGFCNIKLIRQWYQQKNIFKELKEWCVSEKENKTIFVYTVSSSFMIALNKLKKMFPKLKIYAIVADLPNMSSLSSNKSFIKKCFEKNRANASYSRLSCIDGFVLLTKYMADYMKISKPYIVMEGIAPDVQNFANVKSGDIKKIVYTGTLHKKFGVLNLVEAFKTIQDEKIRLVICGIGDSEDEIKEAAQKDSRIDFRGQLKRDEILKLQQEATVLVNPRQNNEEFTKYSFPSKTMEYLASGSPVVAYKLDGIPDEYDCYLNYVYDNSIESLAAKLKDVCYMDEISRVSIGQEGRKFVLENKNACVQTKKIVDFLKTNTSSY